MRVGSLFSGCGLADYGLHQAGFELAWACEIEKQPRAVLRRHFPKAEIHFDVKEMTGGTLEPVELLFFGSPCQDLSVAGKRAGLAGERSGLFAEAMRIVDEMDAPPRICVWENVCGALSSNKGADFATVLTEMGKRWSGIAYRVLDLQWFGVPQRRRRVFVVGHSGGWRSAAEVLFEREGLRRDSAPRREAGQGAARSAEAGVGGGCGPVAWTTKLHNTQSNQAGKWYEGYTPSLNHNSPAPAVFAFAQNPRDEVRLQGGDGKICGALSAEPGVKQTTYLAFGGNNTSGPIDVATACNDCSSSSGRLDFESETFVTHSLRGEGFDGSEDGTGRGTPIVPVACLDVAGTMKACAGKSGGWSNSADHAAAGYMIPVAFPAMLSGTQCASAENLSPSLGAINPTAVAVSLRGREGGDKPHVLVPRAVRRLMPVECERLMGAPDGYTAWGIDDNGNRVEMADCPRYKMIGNGVGVPHSRWIGKRIVEQSK